MAAKAFDDDAAAAGGIVNAEEIVQQFEKD